LLAEAPCLGNPVSGTNNQNGDLKRLICILANLTTPAVAIIFNAWAIAGIRFVSTTAQNRVDSFKSMVVNARVRGHRFANR
jgi:hypothetical protein